MGTVGVVGGGLVGSLMSCFLARRGFDVSLYEMRDDIRTMEHVTGKSINLALSERGQSALRAIGLEQELLNKHAIPMRARLLHDLDGGKRTIPYGRSDQCIYSVGRRHLNELLLTESEKYKNVSVHFKHKLIDCELDSGVMTFSGKDGIVKCAPNFLIGADGAHSAVRRAMMKTSRFDYHQEFIEHGYIELCIPPTADDQFAMEVNYLHIWPRDNFMMIALPNQDKSYTVTLFMPFVKFEEIKRPEQLISFFTEYFCDSVPLIGRDRLIRDFFSTTPNSLISIKCKPYNHRGKALIIGDAAHAMVPFYGQGMNCGFEDCLILDDLFMKFDNQVDKVLSEFTSVRNADGHAICDLAMYNYIEMRHLVNSKKFVLRRRFDVFVNTLFPTKWLSLYGMITFSRIPYSKCVEYNQKQNRILSTGLVLLISSVGLTLCSLTASKSNLLRTMEMFRLS